MSYNGNYQQPKIEDDEEASKCDKCGQEVLEECPTCHQLVYDSPDEDEVCEECGRELPEEDEDDSSSEELRKTYSLEVRKDGTKRACCRMCNRRVESCPNCNRDYSEKEYESEEESEYEEASDSEEEEPKRESKRKRYRKDATDDESTDADEESDDD